MKLRQKLAVVLASAMAVTAVPVVTMAASTNSLSRETLKVKKEVGFYESSTANALKVKFTDADKDKVEVFYLDLENAKWDEDVLKEAAANEGFTKDGDAYTFTSNGATVTYARQNDDTMKVTVDLKNSTTNGDPIVQLPLFAKTKDGDAKVSVVSKGGNTTVTQGTFIFATTAEKKLSVSVADDKTFYTEGSIGDITIEEAYKGSLKDGAKFKIELDDTDFKFTGDLDKVEYKYGFSDLGKSGSGYTGVSIKVNKDDNGVLEVTIPAGTVGDSRGTIVIKGVRVKSTNKKPEQGDFLADFKNFGDGVDDALVSEKSNVKVAKVSEYGIYVKMKDDKAEDVKAGRTEEVEIEVGENVEDSMISSRDFDMTLTNGHWDYKGLVEKLTNKKYGTEEDWLKAAANLDEVKLAKEILDNDGDWKDGTYKASFDTDNDGLAIPETITFTIGKDDGGKEVQDNNDNDKLKFKTKICVPVGNKDKEKVTVKVSGRGLENDAETTAINIVNPFNVTYEQAVLKTGLQGQKAGTVTLTETDKDCLQKGDVYFKITRDNEDFDIYLTDADVEVSAGLKGTKSKIKKGKTSGAAIDLDLNRVSKEAATITFKDLTFTTSRTVPEGTYDLEIYGSAIDGDWAPVEDSDTADNHKLVIKDFIKISTTNTQDITANGLAKGIASFVIGESKYTLNGQEVTMDAPSYIQDPGYTMVPARYVALAFGVAEKDILFNKGTVTIFAGERTINLTTGSNIAVVNGNSIAMSTKVVNKDGRTYIPAGQLASLLGIKSTWDSASKTATFENK